MTPASFLNVFIRFWKQGLILPLTPNSQNHRYAPPCLPEKHLSKKWKKLRKNYDINCWFPHTHTYMYIWSAHTGWEHLSFLDRTTWRLLLLSHQSPVSWEEEIELRTCIRLSLLSGRGASVTSWLQSLLPRLLRHEGLYPWTWAKTHPPVWAIYQRRLLRRGFKPIASVY